MGKTDTSYRLPLESREAARGYVEKRYKEFAKALETAFIVGDQVFAEAERVNKLTRAAALLQEGVELAQEVDPELFKNLAAGRVDIVTGEEWAELILDGVPAERVAREALVWALHRLVLYQATVHSQDQRELSQVAATAAHVAADILGVEAPSVRQLMALAVAVCCEEPTGDTTEQARRHEAWTYRWRQAKKRAELAVAYGRFRADPVREQAAQRYVESCIASETDQTRKAELRKTLKAMLDLARARAVEEAAQRNDAGRIPSADDEARRAEFIKSINEKFRSALALLDGKGRVGRGRKG